MKDPVAHAIDLRRRRIRRAAQAVAAGRVPGAQGRPRNQRLPITNAQQALASENMWVAKAVVTKHYPQYGPGGIPYDDLLQEGHLAILNAVRTFDPGRGGKFSTYAYRAVVRHLAHLVTKANAVPTRGAYPSEGGVVRGDGDYTDDLDAHGDELHEQLPEEDD